MTPQPIKDFLVRSLLFAQCVCFDNINGNYRLEWVWKTYFTLSYTILHSSYSFLSYLALELPYVHRYMYITLYNKKFNPLPPFITPYYVWPTPYSTPLRYIMCGQPLTSPHVDPVTLHISVWFSWIQNPLSTHFESSLSDGSASVGPGSRPRCSHDAS